jgi:hypothetical protein
MIDDDLDDLDESAWDDGYRAALRVLLEADETVEGDRWVTVADRPQLSGRPAQ